MQRRKIFISYAHDDRAIAECLLSELQRVSLVGWMDTADIGASEAISASIRDALRSSSAVVVLLSPKSLSSRWVQFEVGAAEALGKRIIPVIIEGKDIQNSIPDSLQGLHWLDARDKSAREVARQLEEAIIS
jgi:hypothetical protein